MSSSPFQRLSLPGLHSFSGGIGFKQSYSRAHQGPHPISWSLPSTDTATHFSTILFTLHWIFNRWALLCVLQKPPHPFLCGSDPMQTPWLEPRLFQLATWDHAINPWDSRGPLCSKGRVSLRTINWAPFRGSDRALETHTSFAPPNPAIGVRSSNPSSEIQAPAYLFVPPLPVSAQASSC